MENRDRDREQNSGKSAEFGQKIGRSENLEGGDMRNQKEGNNNIGGNRSDKDLDNLNREPSRKPGSEGFGSSGRDRDLNRDVNDVSQSDFSKDKDIPEERH